VFLEWKVFGFVDMEIYIDLHLTFSLLSFSLSCFFFVSPLMTCQYFFADDYKLNAIIRDIGC